MRFTPLNLAGAYLIDVELLRDERGFFARTYCAREFTAHRLVPVIAQCSTSFNAKRGTVRGMHYQAQPHAEEKVVRCTSGAIFDVIVDIRPESPTYLHWHSVELTAKNHRMLYIPAGFAHGFQTLVDDTEVNYQISVDYAPAASRGIHWTDPALNIAWPFRNGVIVSERDAAFPGVYG